LNQIADAIQIAIESKHHVILPITGKLAFILLPHAIVVVVNA